MPVPLDKYVVDCEKTGHKVPALDPRWAVDMNFLRYVAPPLCASDTASLEEWAELLSFIEEDLHCLLALPHDKFWCQVIFEDSILQCIDSYLRYAPRSYDVVSALPAEVQEQSETIYRLVFLVCVRMATHKESKEHFITPSVFGDIIYENFIFDIPKLMDLCVLYGASNGPLLSKMIGNIFTHQYRYHEDLHAVVPTILQVFESIQKKCADDKSTGGTPQKLGTLRRKNVLEELPVAEFQDIILYLLDTSATLWQLLQVYTPIAAAFAQDNFLIKLAQFYELILPSLSEAMKNRDWSSAGVQNLLRGKLHRAQINLLNVFHHILDTTCLQPLLDSSESSHAEKHIEEYLTVVSGCIAEKRFLGHLESLHTFQQDWDLLLQTEHAVDETRLQFLQEGILEAYMTHGKGSKKEKQTQKDKFSALSQLAVPTAAAVTFGDEPGNEESELGGACAPGISEVELQSLMTNVKELLPDLGDGFIEACLEEYNYDVEGVINDLLEDSLLPQLQDLDRYMQRAKPKDSTYLDPHEAAKEESVLSSVLGSRKNVFDNDEFDVFTRSDVDATRIRVGKKLNVPSNKKDAAAFLDDKSTIQAVRGRYDPYGSGLVEIDEDQNAENKEYDDEYDDTYDTNQIGADDADSADELTTRRPFTMPRVLYGGTRARASKQDSYSESEDSDGSQPRDKFVEDPAVIRERQAQRYASRQQHQGHKPQQQAPKSYDVKGNAKGQGQSNEVLRNRAYKEKNKSSRVNHNRKAMSDRKRRVP